MSQPETPEKFLDSHGDFAIREDGRTDFTFWEAPLCDNLAGAKIHGVQTWQASLRKKLKEKGLTQKTLARRLHRSEAAISQYLSGDRDPSPEMFGKLCAAVRASADELLGLPVQPAERIDGAFAGIKAAVDAARALLSGPAPETTVQELETIERGIRERDARKGTTTLPPQSAGAGQR